MKIVMRINNWLAATSLFCCLAVAGLAQTNTPTETATSTPAPKINIATAAEIKAEFDNVPCKNDARLSAVKALFEKLGAPPEALQIVKLKNVENLVVRKPGQSEEKILIGAHYDKVSAGCGALDNWTGIVALAHLYRTLQEMKTNKTLLFVAFGREEEGLIGSAAMVKAIAKEQLPQYCTMVNLDSFGLAVPQVMRNTSSPKLEALAEEVAKQMQMPLAKAPIQGADADSSSFLSKKIPAITLHGLNNDWRTMLHSGNDQASKVNAESVYSGYRLALSLLVRLDQAGCQAFR
jgi:Zn-dependent M28 family amino/carboxypeptidase